MPGPTFFAEMKSNITDSQKNYERGGELTIAYYGQFLDWIGSFLIEQTFLVLQTQYKTQEKYICMYIRIYVHVCVYMYIHLV